MHFAKWDEKVLLRKGKRARQGGRETKRKVVDTGRVNGRQVVGVRSETMMIAIVSVSVLVLVTTSRNGKIGER